MYLLRFRSPSDIKLCGDTKFNYPCYQYDERQILLISMNNRATNEIGTIIQSSRIYPHIFVRMDVLITNYKD